MKTVFVTGCSGSLGKNLILALIDRGYSVHGFDISSPPKLLNETPLFQFIKGDIIDFKKLCSSMKKADVAIHSAALLPQKNYLGQEAYIRINAGGAVNFIKACKEMEVPKAIVVSTTGVLEPNSFGITYDSAEYRKKGTPYVTSKILAEKSIEEMNLRDKMNYLILRPASIYGQGMSYKWNDIFKMAKKGRAFVIAPGNAPYSLIHIDDLVNAILLAVSRLDKKISGEKITITSNEPLTIYEILQVITEYYASRSPIKIPFIPAYIMAFMIQSISKAVKNEFLSAITPENILDYRRGILSDHTKAVNLLGFESKKRYQDEIVKVLKEFE